MQKRNFQWPEEVPVEQKLYFLITLMNRKRTGKLYESIHLLAGASLRSAEIYQQECIDLDYQARGIIPPRFRDIYELPSDYALKTAHAPLPDLPPDWADLYLCGARCIAIPKPVDRILATLQPSYGQDPLQSYLEAETHSFGHWLAAVKQAKGMGLPLPQRPKGKVPEALKNQVSELALSEDLGPQESKFEVWKRNWEAGDTSVLWRGRIPVGAQYPEGYKTVKMQLEELESQHLTSTEDPADHLAQAKAALAKKSTLDT